VKIVHLELTTVPRRATLAPALLTRASTTLPKLPSPISFSTSKRSSKADPGEVREAGDARWAKSCTAVILAVHSSACYGY
jgi:hypothetical protein